MRQREIAGLEAEQGSGGPSAVNDLTRRLEDALVHGSRLKPEVLAGAPPISLRG